MNLERIVGGLLPRDRREQVLGDLQERGFRLRDFSSVLPRVWWSHFRRQIGGPLPNIAAANEPAILQRIEQLRNQGRLIMTSALAFLFGSIALKGLTGMFESRVWTAFLLVGLAATLGALVGRFRSEEKGLLSLDSSRRRLLLDYQSQLRFQMNMMWFLAVLPGWLLLRSGAPGFVFGDSLTMIIPSVGVTGFFMTFSAWRILRLRREIQVMAQNPASLA